MLINLTPKNKEPDAQVLAVPNPERQDSLESENTPDPFSSEQTWPTQEELQEAEGNLTIALADQCRENEAY